jgi:hypothetical protein
MSPGPLIQTTPLYRAYPTLVGSPPHIQEPGEPRIPGRVQKTAVGAVFETGKIGLVNR